jgi:3-hydroxybutyryl-CoA dehydrogenase
MIALIGATPTAEFIAARALSAGLQVVIDDVSDARLQSVSTNLHAVASSANSPLPNLQLTQSIESAVRSADFLIDTLPDDLEVKLELFTLFDKFAKPSAIFITIGSIPIDDLAEITFCPDRCVALRLTVAPDNAKPAYQLIPGKQTSPQALAICTQLLGKFLSS